MPIATVKQLCIPSAVVKSDCLVEQVAQIEDFASGKVDGRAFFQRNFFTAFGKFIADETEKWGKVVRAANIRAD
jgi:hypothetical protein